jgi:predicted phage baseplate assembly protein
LKRIIWDTQGITAIRHSLAATGGVDPEPLDEARQFAPQAFRVQQRAVTEADYAAIAQRHPQVQKAAARFRWTGSWYTVFVTIDRKGGRDVNGDPAFEEEIRTYLNQYRLAGYDIRIDGPVFVPLDIQLQICVAPGYFRSDVKQRLLAAFSNQVDSLGHAGFFFADNFTFGQTVFLSQIIEHAMSVQGVASVTVLKFQRFGRPVAGEIAAGYLSIGLLEVAQLSNDPNFPEQGRIDFVLQGGL